MSDKTKAQTLFDNALFGIREQGKGSAVVDGHQGFTCKYLTPDGCKCAIGQSIPPDQYLPVFEGQTLWVPNSRNPYAGIRNDLILWFLDSFGEENLVLGVALQVAHDAAMSTCTFNGADWEIDMLRIAQEHGVDYTRVDPSNLDELPPWDYPKFP